MSETKSIKDLKQKLENCRGMIYGGTLNYKLTAFEVMELYKTGERDFSNLSLRDLDFSGQTLDGVNLSRSDLRGSDFRATRLAGANLDRVRASGCKFYHAFLPGASFQRATLNDIDLSAANLENTVFYMAIMTGADLSESILVNADLTSASLQRVNLMEANLRGVDLDNADLINAIVTDCPWLVSVSGVGETMRNVWAWDTGKSKGVRLGCQQFTAFSEARLSVREKYESRAYISHYLDAYLTALNFMEMQLEANKPLSE